MLLFCTYVLLGLTKYSLILSLIQVVLPVSIPSSTASSTSFSSVMNYLNFTNLSLFACTFSIVPNVSGIAEGRDLAFLKLKNGFLFTI
jgi:hypothetical protein